MDGPITPVVSSCHLVDFEPIHLSKFTYLILYRVGVILPIYEGEVGFARCCKYPQPCLFKKSRLGFLHFFFLQRSLFPSALNPVGWCFFPIFDVTVMIWFVTLLLKLLILQLVSFSGSGPFLSVFY